MALARVPEVRRVEDVHERKVEDAEYGGGPHQPTQNQQDARDEQSPGEAGVDHAHRGGMPDGAQRAAEQPVGAAEAARPRVVPRRRNGPHAQIGQVPSNREADRRRHEVALFLKPAHHFFPPFSSFFGGGGDTMPFTASTMR